MNEISLYTYDILCISYVNGGLVKAFIWSIPPICSCTDYNISKSNNIIIMIHMLAFFCNIISK